MTVAFPSKADERRRRGDGARLVATVRSCHFFKWSTQARFLEGTWSVQVAVSLAREPAAALAAFTREGTPASASKLNFF